MGLCRVGPCFTLPLPDYRTIFVLINYCIILSALDLIPKENLSRTKTQNCHLSGSAYDRGEIYID